MGNHSSLWDKARPQPLISRLVVMKNFQLLVPIHPKKMHRSGVKMESSVPCNKADVATEHTLERGLLWRAKSTKAEGIPIKMIPPSLKSLCSLDGDAE